MNFLESPEKLLIIQHTGHVKYSRRVCVQSGWLHDGSYLTMNRNFQLSQHIYRTASQDTCKGAIHG